MAITIDSSSLLTSVAASSSVAGNVVTLVPRETAVEAAAPTWWPVTAKLLGTAGTTPRVRVVTTGSPFGFSGPLSIAESFYGSYDLLTWFPLLGTTTSGSGYIEFGHNAPFTGDVWISRDRREGVVKTAARIAALAIAHPTKIAYLAGQSSFVCDTYTQQTDENGRVIPGQSLFGFLVKDNSLGVPATKKRVFFTSGVHGPEDFAGSAMWEAIYLWCGSSAGAIALRTAFELVVLPLMNPMGREGGNCRGSFQFNGTINDLNRHFEESPAPIESVGKPRTVLLANATAACPFFIDFHSSVNNAGGYVNAYFTSSGGFAPLNTAFGTRWATHISASSLGATVAGDYANGYTDAWAGTALSAQLAETLEFNTAVNYSDADIVAKGQSITVTLGEMTLNAEFGAYSATPGSALVAAGTASAVGTASLTTAVRCVAVATATAIALATPLSTQIRCAAAATASAVANTPALTSSSSLAPAPGAASAIGNSAALTTAIQLASNTPAASAIGYGSLFSLNGNAVASAIGAASLTTGIKLASNSPAASAIGTAKLQIPLMVAGIPAGSATGVAALTTAIRLAPVAPMATAIGAASLYSGFYVAQGTASAVGQASLHGGFTIALGTASAVGAAALTTAIRLAATGYANVDGVAYLPATLTLLGAAHGTASATGTAWLSIPVEGTANVLTATLVSTPTQAKWVVGPPQLQVAQTSREHG